MGILLQEELYKDYLKGKPPDLFTNDEKQTRTFDASY